MSTATTVLERQHAIQVLLTEEQIQDRVAQLASQINSVYADTQELIVICILKGGFMFTADLVKRLSMPCQIEFIRLSSYGNEQKSSGVVKPLDLTLPNLNGKDVLVVEDIIDTGLTLNWFLEGLVALQNPNSVRLAVFLDKKETRVKPVNIDFTGFEVENLYVVGYGLDDAGYYRNLPYVGYYDLTQISL
jgi:hypoxanthine phosphoribosyltransferase